MKIKLVDKVEQEKIRNFVLTSKDFWIPAILAVVVFLCIVFIEVVDHSGAQSMWYTGTTIILSFVMLLYLVLSLYRFLFFKTFMIRHKFKNQEDFEKLKDYFVKTGK